MGVKKIPMRMCIGCREMKPKKELIRVVKTTENEIKIDKIGYRARIMNKLKEDAIKYNNKMISLYGKRKKGGNNNNNSSKKEKMVFERKDDGPSCQCLIA